MIFMMRIIKRRSSISVILAIILSAAIGFTAAQELLYTEQRNNNFLFGDVKINLTEEEWDKLPKDEGAVILYPGRTVDKDPAVKNTGVSDIYIFLEIYVPKKESVKIVENEEIKDSEKGVQLFTYEINQEWELIESDCTSLDYNRYVYGYKEIVKKEGKTVPLFNEVKFLNVLEGDIEMGTELTIKVNAKAVQSDYLNLSGEPTLDTIYNEAIKTKE